MSYVIACYRDGIPHAISANRQSNAFELVRLGSDTALNKIFSHPYRAGAQQILTWINKNDATLAGNEFEVCDEAKFRK